MDSTTSSKLANRLNSIGRVGLQVAAAKELARRGADTSTCSIYPFEVLANGWPRVTEMHSDCSRMLHAWAAARPGLKAVGVVLTDLTHSVGGVLFPARRVLEIEAAQRHFVSRWQALLPGWDIVLAHDPEEMSSYLLDSCPWYMLCKARALWFIVERLCRLDADTPGAAIAAATTTKPSTALQFVDTILCGQEWVSSPGVPTLGGTISFSLDPAAVYMLGLVQETITLPHALGTVDVTVGAIREDGTRAVVITERLSLRKVADLHWAQTRQCHPMWGAHTSLWLKISGAAPSCSRFVAASAAGGAIGWIIGKAIAHARGV